MNWKKKDVMLSATTVCSNFDRWYCLWSEMKVFVINLDEQEKDTGCAWFTLPCNIEALKQSIGLPPDSDRYLISDYDFPF